MSHTSSIFQKKSREKAYDREHRKVINFNISRYNAAVPGGQAQFADLNLARERAKNLKWKAIEVLDQTLENFEANITKRGAKVIWCEDAQQANEVILEICRQKNCKTLVKSKSMVTEELHLNDNLAKHHIESIETDLGEYIQQLAGEPPYHIVTPAMHKSREQIAELFAEKLGTDPNDSAEKLTLTARERLRQKYAEAEVGVTGANFIIADIGGIAITENEGNARLSCSMPKTHIVVAGIEKVIPSMTDLALFWPLLSSFGTGQRITSYSTIVTGPRQQQEADGPEEMYVILLDNGRSKMLANEKAREALYCIRCGACLNACPVYKNIGGHTYNTTYSGPIGSVITPQLKEMKEWKHLSHASSLCGNCTEVCAVKINLHELLLENRYEAVEEGYAPLIEKFSWKMWKTAMLKRSMVNMVNGNFKGTFINMVAGAWTKNHSKLKFPKKSFNEQWEARKKQGLKDL
ncbi:LutB/LldF family L-lactate oxidation iron-sulfur protein [Niabella drilacis]|uniref:L-lactate dehydrogenase complex protein LldF n=1 Tax=Niabella drilacis (strain DSM 25811 / CCM 8410 / CCUG 62505 / LMG 26954 / E90) TaxID=1285928 RepID=A0A1G6NIR9_NIADE|nr:LutB/LldF family L-lactate oxidation iron-sulfur protein [Niabella drilacis]SDC67668.1 L-lactate dehydrogenase complex protein LldF [Niabella drilacis]